MYLNTASYNYGGSRRNLTFFLSTTCLHSISQLATHTGLLVRHKSGSSFIVVSLSLFLSIPLFLHDIISFFLFHLPVALIRDLLYCHMTADVGNLGKIVYLLNINWMQHSAKCLDDDDDDDNACVINTLSRVLNLCT